MSWEIEWQHPNEKSVRRETFPDNALMDFGGGFVKVSTSFGGPLLFLNSSYVIVVRKIEEDNRNGQSN